MNIGIARPPYSARCTTIFGWMLPLLVVSSLFNYRGPITLNPIVLSILCVIGIALAVPGVLQVIKLRSKKESKIVTLLSSLAAGFGTFVLLDLNRHGTYVWNELYFTAPLALFSLLTYVGCYVAESKHFVRVYIALDGFHYVRA